MTIVTETLSPHIMEVLNIASQFSAKERLVLAKLLLDSLLEGDIEDEVDWRNLGLTAFEKDWDNPDDAIYDNWRELYGVSAR